MQAILAVELTNDAQAPPLLSSRGTSFDDCTIELRVRFRHMVGDFFAPLFNLSNCGLLLDDSSFQILIQLSQVDHILFDLLNGFMTRAHVVGDGLSLTTAVRVDKLKLLAQHGRGWLKNLQLD